MTAWLAVALASVVVLRRVSVALEPAFASFLTFSPEELKNNLFVLLRSEAVKAAHAQVLCLPPAKAKLVCLLPLFSKNRAGAAAHIGTWS